LPIQTYLRDHRPVQHTLTHTPVTPILIENQRLQLQSGIHPTPPSFTIESANVPYNVSTGDTLQLQHNHIQKQTISICTSTVHSYEQQTYTWAVEAHSIGRTLGPVHFLKSSKHNTAHCEYPRHTSTSWYAPTILHS
jgi:hypothetical protein